jgi:hypothetical protein
MKIHRVKGGGAIVIKHRRAVLALQRERGSGNWTLDLKSGCSNRALVEQAVAQANRQFPPRSVRRGGKQYSRTR